MERWKRTQFQQNKSICFTSYSHFFFMKKKESFECRVKSIRWLLSAVFFLYFNSLARYFLVFQTFWLNVEVFFSFFLSFSLRSTIFQISTMKIKSFVNEKRRRNKYQDCWNLIPNSSHFQHQNSCKVIAQTNIFLGASSHIVIVFIIEFILKSLSFGLGSFFSYYRCIRQRNNTL